MLQPISMPPISKTSSNTSIWWRTTSEHPTVLRIKPTTLRQPNMLEVASLNRISKVMSTGGWLKNSQVGRSTYIFPWNKFLIAGLEWVYSHELRAKSILCLRGRVRNSRHFIATKHEGMNNVAVLDVDERGFWMQSYCHDRSEELWGIEKKPPSSGSD